MDGRHLSGQTLEICWTQWTKTEAKTAAESLGQAVNKVPE